jgi:hypothetical protein
MFQVFYSNTSVGNSTESERIFLKNGKKVRIDYNGDYTGRNYTSHDAESELLAGFKRYET